ncbi:MAG: MerR family transcriptional regulator [Tetrasphaera sp.]|nr:MerR family transcriptional regulator [Tetrasphaera sp.]
MRVAELAELTGTTVRAVRHYQSLGLLDVPDGGGGGRRSYQFSHVARLSRIRWLADAGVPLDQVRTMLGDAAISERERTIADLRSTLAALDDTMAGLVARRERLASLLARAEKGDGITPMPRVIEHFYADVLDRARDDAARAAIRRERDVVEMACYRGELPPVAQLLYTGYDEDGLDASARQFGSDASGLTDDEVETYAADHVARLVARLGDRAAEVAAQVDVAEVIRFYELAIRLAEHLPERRLWTAVLHRLLAAVEELAP